MGQITEDLTYTGNIKFTRQPTFPDGGVTNAKVASNAAIDADKLEHIHARTFAQPNTAATSETRVVHVVVGATGVIRSFSAGSIAKAVGDSTVTVDLKVNGSSVLSSVITLDSSNTNRVPEVGTISADDLAANDVLEVVTIATAGTGTLPTGVFAHVTVSEDPA